MHKYIHRKYFIRIQNEFSMIKVDVFNGVTKPIKMGKIFLKKEIKLHR